MSARFIYIVALLMVVALPLLSWGQWSAHQRASALPPEPPAPVPALELDFLNQILAHNLWDKKRGSIVPGNAKAQSLAAVLDTAWVLLAVTRLADGRADAETDIKTDSGTGTPAGADIGLAVVRHGNKILRVHPGDVLPDGSVMRHVLHNGIEYERDGKLAQRYLFGKADAQ